MFFRRRTQHFVPLELRFRVASPKQRAAISVAPSKLIRNLYDQFSTPQQLWREALFQVKAMNRVKLSSARRLRLCLTVQQRVCTPLDRALDALRKDADGVPEQQAQQALLDLADQMISTLIAGYQIVIDGDYRTDERHRRGQKVRLLRAGIAALELVYVQQRLRALRYQPLQAASWQLANTLFCVMSRAETLETPVSAMSADRLLLNIEGSTTGLRLFSMIQSFGLFDPFSWSKPQ
ncbi:MAG: hypothetical protein WBM40_20985, partial [Thiohalocapsa sp.]